MSSSEETPEFEDSEVALEAKFKSKELFEDTKKPKTKSKAKKKLAIKAFKAGDAVQSATIHDEIDDEDIPEHKEKHKKGGDYLKSIIYGGMDGIITTFAVVAGAAGADLSTEVVIIMGFSNLFSDGISMGIGDFISGRAEIDYAKAEQRREYWEFDSYPQGEKKEMVDIYIKKGVPPEDAKQLVEILSRNRTNFVDTMMAEELGILPPDPKESPAKHGLVTFASFVVFGLVPLLTYVISHAAFGSDGSAGAFNTLFGIAIALTAVTLFGLGALTSRFTIRSWYVGGMSILATGGVAAGLSYLIGWIISFVLGDDKGC